MSTTTDTRPRPGGRKGADRTSTSWAVQYRYPNVRPGLDWVRDETAARHWARVYRRYGAKVKLLCNERGADTWYELHRNGTDLIPLPPAGSTD